MLKKIIISAIAFSSLMALVPQKSYARTCFDVMLAFNSNCRSWGGSAEACNAEATRVYNNCVRYDRANPLPVLNEY